MSGQPSKTRELARERGKLPLYAQVAARIAESIRVDGLAPGDRVASEPELVRTYGISRATAGKALEHLERDGIVRREQGRGTFVESARLFRRQPDLGSFSDHVRSTGHRPTHRLLAVERGAGGERDELAAHMGEGAELVRLVRLRLVDGEPIGVHRTLLHRAVAERAGIDERSLGDAEASLYGLLDAAGVHVAEAVERLEAREAGEEDAALLGLEHGAALMRVLRLSWDAGGRAVEATDARYAGSRFDYSVALARPGFPERGRRRDTTPEERGHADEASGRGDARGGAGGHGGRVRQVG